MRVSNERYFRVDYNQDIGSIIISAAITCTPRANICVQNTSRISANKFSVQFFHLVCSKLWLIYNWGNSLTRPALFRKVLLCMHSRACKLNLPDSCLPINWKFLCKLQIKIKICILSLIEGCTKKFPIKREKNNPTV